MRSLRRAANNDPAPSRLNYRLQRWLLTPGVRLFLRAGVPFAVVFGAVSLYMSDDPIGALNSVGCYALQDPDDPDNPLGGEFMMLSSFSEEPIRFNVQKKRIFRACQAEFAQLIEKLGIECVSMD